MYDNLFDILQNRLKAKGMKSPKMAIVACGQSLFMGATDEDGHVFVLRFDYSQMRYTFKIKSVEPDFLSWQELLLSKSHGVEAWPLEKAEIPESVLESIKQTIVENMDQKGVAMSFISFGMETNKGGGNVFINSDETYRVLTVINDFESL